MQIHTLAADIVKIQDVLMRLPSQLVIDHFGIIPQPQGLQHPALEVIYRLQGRGNTWLKISSAYQNSKTGPPAYADVGEVAKSYLKRAPERMLWDTD